MAHTQGFSALKAKTVLTSFIKINDVLYSSPQQPIEWFDTSVVSELISFIILAYLTIMLLNKF